MMNLIHQIILLQVNPKKTLKYGKKAAKAGISIWFIIIIVLLLLATIGFAMGFYQSIKEKNHKKNAILFHVIGFGLVMMGLGLTAMREVGDPEFEFWLFSGGFFLLGSLHTWFMYLLHKWSNRESFWPEAFFTGYVGCLGTLLFILVYYFMDRTGYGISFGLSILTFPLPFLFVKSFDQFMAFPQRTYAGWKYPNRRPAVMANNIQDATLIHIIISEEHANNAYPRKVLVKVSPEFIFGDFFHAWVHERNHQSNLGTILYLNRGPQNEPISWVFYVKPKYWWQFRRYINPGDTFRKNRISQADMVVALRIKGDTFYSRDISSSASYVDSMSSSTAHDRSIGIKKTHSKNEGGIRIKKRN